MAQKKLMLLGGLRYLLPVIEAAHRLGIYVITVDYLPDNIAHRYSDEYHNVSIIDKEAVLELARELQIDGIMSFAVDPGVVSAAYVAEQLGLPFQCSYESACILQDKSRFRQFLADNGFNVPNARGYDNAEAALHDVDYFNWPVIVKPVDSAGSKGVTRVDHPADLPAAIAHALECSPSRHFIIEDFLEKLGCSSDSDCFSIDGEMVFCSFSDQFFDPSAPNEYTPSAYIWPSTMPQWAQCELRTELQRLITLLDCKTGIYNIETRLCTNGKPYIMELSPRGGGNRIAELLQHATGHPLIENEVRKAVGTPLLPMGDAICNEHYSITVLHSDRDGILNNITIDPKLQSHIIENDLWVKIGDQISGFTGANQSLGTLFMRYKTRKQIEAVINKPSQYIHIGIQ